MKRYAEIRTDYVENDKYCYIDTWETADDDEEGHAVAKVDLGNGEITWLDTNSEVLSNPQIAIAISEVIREHRINIYK